MKNAWLLISFLFMFLFASKAMDGLLLPVAGEVEECALQDVYSSSDQSAGYILPVSSGFLYRDMVMADVSSLAIQFRLAVRIFRSVSLHYSFLNKMFAWRQILHRLELLAHSCLNVYSTLPHQSWNLPSDHYIFGMRRILI